MGTRLFISTIALLFLSTSFADDLSQWVEYTKPIAEKNLLRNISAPGTAKGCVVASPSQENPDYFYHWVRDAGITMDVVVQKFIGSKGVDEKTQLETVLHDYISFSYINQSTPNLSGGPGEPKFRVDGSAFLGDWGRPQDDGPALRALSLLRLANYWLAQGKKDQVVQKLYSGDKNSVIKFDLEYVANNWRNTSFELWEEVRGHHFYTRAVQRKALEEGAKLAEYLGDTNAAGWYRLQARSLENEMHRHWDASKKILVQTIDWDGGVPYKTSGLDSAIVLAVLHGGKDSGDFSILDDKVLATVLKLEEVFQSIYPINHKGYPAVAVGRYPEDRYDGYSTSGEGNPWILITSAYAEFYYRLGKTLKQQDGIQITSLSRPFYSKLLGRSLKNTRMVQSNSSLFQEIIDQALRKGDQFLTRVKIHTDGDGAMAEQLNRHTGFQQGARDLTWSYGAFLTALQAR